MQARGRSIEANPPGQATLNVLEPHANAVVCEFPCIDKVELFGSFKACKHRCSQRCGGKDYLVVWDDLTFPCCAGAHCDESMLCMSEGAIGSGLPGCQGSNEREIEGRKEEAKSWPASWGSYGGRTMNDRTNEGDRRSYKLKPD